MFRLATLSPGMPFLKKNAFWRDNIFFNLINELQSLGSCFRWPKKALLLKQKSKLSFFTLMFQERDAIKAGIFVCLAIFCTLRAFHTWVGWFTNTTCGFFKSINKSYNRFRWPGCYLGNNWGLVEGYPIVAVSLPSYYLL